jgi:hypothetical protein
MMAPRLVESGFSSSSGSSKWGLLMRADCYCCCRCSKMGEFEGARERHCCCCCRCCCCRVREGRNSWQQQQQQQQRKERDGEATSALDSRLMTKGLPHWTDVTKLHQFGVIFAFPKVLVLSKCNAYQYPFMQFNGRLILASLSEIAAAVVKEYKL